jgi:hypothetical protein
LDFKNRKWRQRVLMSENATDSGMEIGEIYDLGHDIDVY